MGWMIVGIVCIAIERSVPAYWRVFELLLISIMMYRIEQTTHGESVIPKRSL